MSVHAFYAQRTASITFFFFFQAVTKFSFVVLAFFLGIKQKGKRRSESWEKTNYETKEHVLQVYFRI